MPGDGHDIPVSVWWPGSGGAGASAPAHWVLHAPAFGEEMNKARHVVARQARLFAHSGMPVIVPDLYGTGDSGGDFADASWDSWCEDLRRVAAWAYACGARRLSLWGLRLGCLLALEAARGIEPAPARLVLWQPVHRGEQQLAQFLRLLKAAELTGLDRSRPGVAEARAELAAGGAVEIAGYRLSAPLSAGIAASRLDRNAVPRGTPVALFEVAGAAQRPLSRLSSAQLTAWRDGGVDCQGAVVVGDPFWATQELGFSTQLLHATVEHFAASSSTSGRSADNVTKAQSRSARPVALAGPEHCAGTGEGCVFACRGEALAGRLHRTSMPADTGVVIVVGGPQYRVGSHRLFRALAGELAAAGFPVLRFDYRGMGDSGGELRGFTAIAEDIGSAVDALCAVEPTVNRVVLWGLCDAATAAAVYAPQDSRVAGLVLANPWVYSERGAARIQLSTYYRRRLLTPAFWRKLASGRLNPLASLRGLGNALGKAVGRRPAQVSAGGRIAPAFTVDEGDLARSIGDALSAFRGDVLLLLSGEDYTAAEFDAAAKKPGPLRAALRGPRRKERRFPAADHTFSRQVWRHAVADASLSWLRDLP